MNEIEPDPVVRTALQRLPIPSHSEDFWSRLDSALVAEGAPSAAVRSVFVSAPTVEGEPDEQAVPTPHVGEPDPALALVPQALRRPSNGVLLAVAAAAAVVVTLAGTTLLDERSGTKTQEAAQPSSAVETLVKEAQADDAVPAPLSAESVQASSDAVLAWVDDLGTGDGAKAWEAMGPTSQAHFGTMDAFEAEMSSLAEELGAWSTAEPDDVIVTPVESTDDGTLAVVTLVGVVDQDGTQHRRADAFPVRLVDSTPMLEPYAFAGAIEVVVPAEEPAEGVADPVGDDEELVIVVPSEVEAPVLRLDDGETVVCGRSEGTELTDLEGTPGQRCSYRPPEGIEPGEHALTMAFLSPDGSSISAESVLFDAA